MLNKVRRMLPHAAILICNMYIVFFLIDRVNPAMNFIDNNLTKGLLLVLCVVALVNARALKQAVLRPASRSTAYESRRSPSYGDRRPPARAQRTNPAGYERTMRTQAGYAPGARGGVGRAGSRTPQYRGEPLRTYGRAGYDDRPARYGRQSAGGYPTRAQDRRDYRGEDRWRS